MSVSLRFTSKTITKNIVTKYERQVYHSIITHLLSWF